MLNHPFLFSAESNNKQRPIASYTSLEHFYFQMIDWLARFHCDFPRRLYQWRLNLYTGHGFDLYDLFEVQQLMIAMYCDECWFCGVVTQLWLVEEVNRDVKSFLCTNKNYFYYFNEIFLTFHSLLKSLKFNSVVYRYVNNFIQTKMQITYFMFVNEH